MSAPRKQQLPTPVVWSWELQRVSGSGLKAQGLIRLRLLGLRLFLGDVLDSAFVRFLQPLTPERVVDERVGAGRILRLGVAHFQKAHVVRIRVAVQEAMDVDGDLYVRKFLLEALDALEELRAAFDTVARARA